MSPRTSDASSGVSSEKSFPASRSARPAPTIASSSPAAPSSPAPSPDDTVQVRRTSRSTSGGAGPDAPNTRRKTRSKAGTWSGAVTASARNAQ